jgi:hypothetical protein
MIFAFDYLMPVLIGDNSSHKQTISILFARGCIFDF